MILSKLETLITGYLQEGHEKAFEEGGDVHWDDFIEIRKQVEAVLNQPVRGKFSVLGVMIHPSNTVTRGSLFPCNCRHDKS